MITRTLVNGFLLFLSTGASRDACHAEAHACCDPNHLAWEGAEALPETLAAPTSPMTERSPVSPIVVAARPIHVTEACGPTHRPLDGV